MIYIKNAKCDLKFHRLGQGWQTYARVPKVALEKIFLARGIH
jgi:hypothetical protein